MRAFLTIGRVLGLSALAAVPSAVMAAGAIEGEAVRQPTNWTAIGMFAVFVVLTLFITKWAAGRTKSAADFYTAGGGISGFQNGLAIAGDYMSAASFLGISAAVMAPQSLAFIHALFQASEKNRALSLYGATFGLASAAGQLLGGVLVALDLLEATALVTAVLGSAGVVGSGASVVGFGFSVTVTVAGASVVGSVVAGPPLWPYSGT